MSYEETVWGPAGSTPPAARGWRGPGRWRPQAGAAPRGERRARRRPEGRHPGGRCFEGQHWGGEARGRARRGGAGRRTMVLILPFSVVMLSRWCRWAKGLAAPHDSRYRVMRTDALILAPSSVWRGLNRCCGLRRSPWGQETERHLRAPQAHACSPHPRPTPPLPEASPMERIPLAGPPRSLWLCRIPQLPAERFSPDSRSRDRSPF